MAIIAVATVVAWLPLAPTAEATGANLPPRPTRTPMPTPTPGTPSPTPTSQPILTPLSLPEPRPTKSEALDGSLIELHIRLGPGLTATAASQLWTVVQWQDSSGGWHAVEGWQGRPDQVAGGAATKVWWLPASLLGQGGFRWAVFEAYGGRRIGASEEFLLPSRAGERLLIEMTVTP